MSYHSCEIDAQKIISKIFAERIVVFRCLYKSVMESKFDLLREENARLMAKIAGLESKKAELLSRL